MHAQVMKSMVRVAISVQESEPRQHALHAPKVTTVVITVAPLDVDPARKGFRSRHAANPALCLHMFAVPVTTSHEDHV
eukprot:Skav219615  [mRNA]  locus=scaffold628:128763:129265:+ [translate_table: standard]